MKITKIAMAMLFAAIIVSSCKTVNDALDVTFDTSFKSDLNIDVPAGTKADINGSFSESATIDPMGDPNVAKYADNIKSFEVTAITGKIVAINKDVNISNFNIAVASATMNASWNFPSVAVTQGTELTLSNDDGQWDTINSILGDKDVFTVSASGETDQDDVQFSLQITISTRVTANPL